MSVANQDIVRLGNREPWDKEHIYSRMHIDALQEAMNNLKGETLKLWLYLNKNVDKYELELSQKACEAWGLKKDAYYTAKKKLIELGYLTPVKDGSNIYTFSEKPKQAGGLSEKPKNFSEKPKTFSEKPQRNITNTTIENNIGGDVSAIGCASAESITLQEEPEEERIKVTKEWLERNGVVYELTGANVGFIVATGKLIELK